MQFIVLFPTCVGLCYMSTLKALCIGSAYIDFVRETHLRIHCKGLIEQDNIKKYYKLM